MDVFHDDPSHQQRLQKLAVSDSAHDFDTAFTDIYKIFRSIGTPVNTPQVPVRKGWDLIKEVTNLKDIEKALPGASGTFRTVTNMDYTYAVFHETDIDSSLKFLHAGLGKANLIFDAITGHWWDTILSSKGKHDPALGTIRIITNRETVSDPASKPSPNDKEFTVAESKKRRVLIESYIDSSKDPVAYPAWKLPRAGPSSDFFSDYTLELSDVNYVWEGEEISLTFRHPEFESTIPVTSYGKGKSANAKKFLRPKLNAFEDNLAKKKATQFQKHQYFTILQQKRGGDTLQILSSLDTTRTYDSVFEVGKVLDSLETTLTYTVTNDTFNTTPVGLLNGANVVLLNSTSVFIFRKGLARDPVTAFIEGKLPEKQKLIADYIKRVQDHTSHYMSARQILYNQISSIIRQHSSEAYDRDFVRGDVPALQSAVNSAIRSVLLYTYQLALFTNAYEPVFVQIQDLNSREQVSRLINAIQVQSLRQFADGSDAVEKLRSLELDFALQTITNLNFFVTKQTLQQAQYIKELRVVFGIIPMIARKEAPALSAISAWLQSLLETKFISSTYTKTPEKQGFLVILSLLESCLPSVSSASKRSAEGPAEGAPMPKRGGSGSLLSAPGSERKSFSPASTLSVLSAMPVQTSERTLLQYAFQILREDLRVDEPTSIPSPSASLLKFVRANLTTPEDLWNLVVLRTIAFTNSLPLKREDTDDFKLWASVFINLLQQIERTENKALKYSKVPAFLTLWTLPSETIATLLRLPADQSWTAYGQQVGTVLLEYIQASFEPVDVEGVFVPSGPLLENAEVFSAGEKLLDSLHLSLPGLKSPSRTRRSRQVRSTTMRSRSKSKTQKLKGSTLSLK